ncbi:hypothetical protein BD410DRAFT_157074 [Rickenella mellea]|uniref:Uncharacterized protein n=1 Tax=Rickenella mellea TaxID=50990 RepID=A0A4Y7Q829_9AGAM|nr:hypothetical protein BD410DRAFT_157074 [Rickenella mellea]
MFLYPWDIHPVRLKSAITYFGLNPRQTWEASRSDISIRGLMDEVQQAVAAIVPSKTLEILLLGTTNGDPTLGISHTIFEIVPKGKYRLFYAVHVQAKSEWILDLVLTWYERRQPDAAYQFYKQTKCAATTASLAGVIWKRQVYRYFRSIRNSQSISLVSLQDKTIHRWDYPGGAEMVQFRVPGLTDALQTAVKKQEACYLQALNFKAVDSLVYQPGGLSCIQITDAMTQPIQVGGLQVIQKCITLEDAGLASLRPLYNGNGRLWPFIFVVPEDSKFSRVPQKLEGGTKIWRQKIHQFLLALPETKVWCVASS